MKVFIADINEISKHRLMTDEYLKRLSTSDLQKYGSIKNSKRKNQFLVGRMLLYDNYGYDFAAADDGRLIADRCFLSLTHSRNIVALAVSERRVGIDAEYADTKRNILELAAFMNFAECRDAFDFYKQFTAYEANYKAHAAAVKLQNRHYVFDDYVLCLAYQDAAEPIFIYKTVPFKFKSSFDLIRPLAD